MYKTLARVLGASLAGLGIGLFLFWLVTRMIAPDQHRRKDKRVSIALAHSAPHVAIAAQVPSPKASAAGKSKPSSQTKHSRIRGNQHGRQSAAKSRPALATSPLKHPARVADVEVPKVHVRREKTAFHSRIAKHITHPARWGSPYLPSPSRHLLRPSHLNVTQIRYVCPYYPGFPHVGLNLEFSAHVNKIGQVIDFAVLSGGMSPAYRAALQRAVLQWRFRPLHKNGKRLAFRIIDRVHVANVGHTCLYNYTSAGRPTATGRVPHWAVYLISGVKGPPVAMKLNGSR